MTVKRATVTASAESDEADARWRAVVARDAGAEGTFFYAVRTTGVFCRPSCSARTPKRENVEFHLSPVAAERAGFRACKRCRPGQPSLAQAQAIHVAELCRFLEAADPTPSLSELSLRSGLSPYHLHRVFKASTGLTPRAYAAAHRGRRMREALERSPTITEAIYSAGFNSSGRFYERTNAVLGMTPTSYRRGGAQTGIRFAVGACSLGAILVAATETGVCAVLLGDDANELTRDLQDRFPRATVMGGDAEFERWVAKVVGAVEAPGTGLNLPLDVRGTAFQQRVWAALQKIPVGSTASYSEIAKLIGSPKSVRAVAQACGANALAVLIPCHRVVRMDGGLSGYRWGVERKRALLTREAVRQHLPK